MDKDTAIYVGLDVHKESVCCGFGGRSGLEHRSHPEQGYRACLGMQRLARQFTLVRLEAACTRALAIRSPNLRSVTNIPKSGLDRQQSLPTTKPGALPAHENIRGPDYFH